VSKYSVPNAPAVPYLDQAEPDDFDYQALGNRRTGIFSGGVVTALGTPGPSVEVTAGKAIIADNSVSFNAGTVAVANGGANPRFDIIAVSSEGVLTNIPGAASANALIADFDFDLYAPLASVYVPPGSTSVLGSHIALKAMSMPQRFVRQYTSANSMFLSSEVQGSTSVFSVLASGVTRWGSNVLRRLTDTSMEWATSLRMKAIGVDHQPPVLILRCVDTDPTAHRLLQAQASNGGEVAYINGLGQLYANNFKFGSGNPNGIVVGKKGDLFISRNNGGSSLGIWQKGGSDGTKTDWVSFRVYDPSESTLPTGTLIHSMSMTAPAGFIGSYGQWINTTGSTADLAAMIGSRFGSQPGQIKMPDLRGMTLSADGPTLPVFTEYGARTIELTIANMPEHAHNVNDPGHDHPQAGPHAYIMPWQYHNNRHPVPSGDNLEHVYTEPSGFNRNARTGITLGKTGKGEPFSAYQPTHTVNLYVKL
jgi:microcystin-dependent protein